jgi:type IV pilus assembly protein PilB
MVDMGIEPFLVSSSTNLIMAQRLLRKICTACKTDVRLHPEVLRELSITEEEAAASKFQEGKGCVECNNTGYKGRVGVYEAMPISAKIRELILDRASVALLKKQAVEDGMLTLRSDGLGKLKNGTTTAEEVLKETAPDR